MQLKSGHEVVEVEESEQEELVKHFKTYKHGLIRIQPGNWLYFKNFLKFADRIYDYKFRPTDVVVMTYPKCGTTWMQEIVWTMRNNLSFDHPDSHISVMLRAIFIESDFLDDPELGVGDLETNFDFINYFQKICPKEDPKNATFIQIAEDTPDPRTIKTHLPFSFFQPNMLDVCKVIFVARNPKDTCLSYYHHNRLLLAHGFTGNLDSFIDHFMNDTTIYSSYWRYMKEAWERRGHPNLLFCFYEEMKENPKKNVERINDFLKTDLTEEQIDKVVEYTSFSAMKQRDSFTGYQNATPEYMDKEVLKQEGGFFRKGKVGDWRTKFSKEQEERINAWSEQHLKEFGPDFLYCKKM